MRTFKKSKRQQKNLDKKYQQDTFKFGGSLAWQKFLNKITKI